MRSMARCAGLQPVAPSRRHRTPSRRRGRGTSSCAAVRLSIAIAAVILGATFFGVPSADAAFPGGDGPVVFASASGLFFSHACGGRFGVELFVVVPGGSRPHQLTCDHGFDAHPFVSPDGSQVVYTNFSWSGASQLFTLPLTPAGNRHRARPTLVSSSTQDGDDEASWSPADDGTIVFARTVPGAMPQLFVENVADPLSAAPLFSAPTGFADSDPVYDPSDPDLIVFVRRIDDNDHIFSYDTSTQAISDLSAQAGSTVDDTKPDFDPVGSPGRLVFQSSTGGDCRGPQLLTMALDGSDRQAVLGTPPDDDHIPGCSMSADNPSFSPQGDAVVFDRHDRWGERVYRVAVDAKGAATGEAHPLDHGVFLAGEPNWGPLGAPPSDTPEVALPVILPLAGVVSGGVAVAVRRRRSGAGRRPSSSVTGGSLLR